MDIYGRYPALFPFLLQELGDLLGFDVQTDGREVKVTQHEASSEMEHPSLFPLLLLLSKMRAQVASREEAARDEDEEEPSPPDNPNEELPTGRQKGEGKEVGGNDVKTSSRGKSSAARFGTSYELFIPMVQLCSGMKRYQVRTIAAKALVALVPGLFF